MTLIEDGYLDEPSPPPRRSGCLSVLSLALLLAIAPGLSATPQSQEGGDYHGAELHGDPVTLPAANARPHKPTFASLSAAVSPVALASTPAPSGAVGSALIGGWISWADPDLGGDYLATRFPRGTLVRLCTPNRCIVRRSNDFGPSAKIDPPRIADLAVLDWESLCGLPRARGVCRGTVEAIDEIALPPTDTEGE